MPTPWPQPRPSITNTVLANTVLADAVAADAAARTRNAMTAASTRIGSGERTAGRGKPEVVKMRRVEHEVQDVAPGLWIWRIEHPEWAPHVAWAPRVTSTCVESGGEIAVLDPLAPPADAAQIWTRLDARPPTLAVVLKPDQIGRAH